MKTLALVLRRPTLQNSYRMKRWLETAGRWCTYLRALTLLAVGFTVYSGAFAVVVLLVLSVALPDGSGSRLLQDVFWRCLDFVRDANNFVKG